MKGIVSLYVKMLRDMNITTIKQAKRLITDDDLRQYHITPQQHKWNYAHMALKHLVKTKHGKTKSKSKPSVGALSLNQYRELMLADIDSRIEQLPDGDPFKAGLLRTRKAIEEQQVPLS